jgi:hypothetical protein
MDGLVGYILLPLATHIMNVAEAEFLFLKIRR